MHLHAPRDLPKPPPQVVREDGSLASGRYAGCIERIDWRHLAAAQERSALWRRLHHKRWQYVGISHETFFIGMAIVDVGWTCTAFAYFFDRQARRLLVDWSQDGLPGLQCQVSDAPVQGAKAFFKGWGARLELQQSTENGLALQVRVPGLQLEAEIDLSSAAPLLLAVGPIAHGGGLAHATQKSSALALRGQLHVKGQTYALDGATACLDASNGLLSRHTDWRWASAHRADVGFNLQSGYFGAQENALWLDGQLIALDAAQFEFDVMQPLQPWRVWTVDGLLDLQFRPEGARQQDRNLGIAASHYVQPIGFFSGWVRPSAEAPARRVEHLLGVTEDHRSTW